MSVVHRELLILIIVMPLSRLAPAADPHPRHRNLLLVRQHRHHHLSHTIHTDVSSVLLASPGNFIVEYT
jgi:hypothetical protein